MLKARAPLEQLQVSRNVRFRAESRERARAGSQYFRPEISVPPTRCSSNEIILVDGAPPRTAQLSVCKYFAELFRQMKNIS